MGCQDWLPQSFVGCWGWQPSCVAWHQAPQQSKRARALLQLASVPGSEALPRRLPIPSLHRTQSSAPGLSVSAVVMASCCPTWT